MMRRSWLWVFSALASAACADPVVVPQVDGGPPPDAIVGGDDAAVDAAVDATSANREPIAVDDSVVVRAGVATSIDVLANDSEPDGDPLTIVRVGDATTTTATTDGATITYTSAPGFAGEEVLEYEVRDAADARATATLRVRVHAAPSATDDDAITPQGTDVRIAVLANDVHPDGLPLVVGALGAPSHGTASVDGSDVVYSPEPAFSGIDSLTYEILDDVGGTDTATITISVTPTLTSGQIAAGGNHVLALRADGSLVGWGSVPRRPRSATPIAIDTRTDWARVATGPAHACVIDTSGALWCWGNNNDGALGLGDTTSRSDPTRVGTDVGWSEIAAGRYHTCGIRAGALYCWGEGNAGKLGLGDTMLRTVPTLVPSALPSAPWTAIAGGDEHTCGIRGGELWCWGDNGQYQLGDPSSTTDSSVPVRVGASSDWSMLAAGGAHTCAITTTGLLWCWGRVGSAGAPVTMPMRIGASNGWTAVAAGSASVCAIDGGALHCWGDNLWGQVGDGTQTSRAAPVRIGSGSDWVDVTVGISHACAMRASGAVSCWGARANGQLGDGVATGATTPTRVGTGSDWASVTAGHSDATCASRTDGTLWCWGASIGPTSMPLAVPTQVGTMAGWTLLPDAGPSHLCAIRSDGGLWCWGNGIYGRLGIGSSATHAIPQPVGGTTTYVDAAAGNSHTCAVTGTGALQCWGLGAYGRLGVGSTAPSTSTTPLEVSGAGTYATVAAGALHTCGTRTDGTAWCWGYGIGDVPTRVGTDSDWREVIASRLGTCGIRTSGALWCWTDAGTGLARVGLDADWAVVASGAEHTCGVRTGGSLWCFGANDEGALGDGTTTNRALPVRVGTDSNWLDVAGGGGVFSGHTCAIRTDGSLWCWGAGAYGQLGLGNALSTTPVAVSGG